MAKNSDANEKRRARRKELQEIWRKDMERIPEYLADRVRKRNDSAKTEDEKIAAYQDGVNAFVANAGQVLESYPVPKLKGAERDNALAARKALVQRLAKLFGVSVGKTDDGLGGMPKRIAQQLDWDVSNWEDDDPDYYKDLMSFAKNKALRY